MRIKLNLSMESIVWQKPNMRVIKLKDAWDSKDSHLVVNDRITEVGMIAYWKAVDAYSSTTQYVMINMLPSLQLFLLLRLCNTQPHLSPCLGQTHSGQIQWWISLIITEIVM